MGETESPLAIWWCARCHTWYSLWPEVCHNAACEGFDREPLVRWTAEEAVAARGQGRG